MDQYCFMQSFLMIIRILHISLFTEIFRNGFEIIIKCWDCSLHIPTAPLTHIKNHSASSFKATCAAQLSGALPSSEVAPCSVLKKGYWKVKHRFYGGDTQKADMVNLLNKVRIWSLELLAVILLSLNSFSTEKLFRWVRIGCYLFVSNG